MLTDFQHITNLILSGSNSIKYLMSKYGRIRYFLKPGPRNTNEVIKAVIERVESGNIDSIVVASTSGRTGLKFAKAIRGESA